MRDLSVYRPGLPGDHYKNKHSWELRPQNRQSFISLPNTHSQVYQSSSHKLIIEPVWCKLSVATSSVWPSYQHPHIPWSTGLLTPDKCLPFTLPYLPSNLKMTNSKYLSNLHTPVQSSHQQLLFFLVELLWRWRVSNFRMYWWESRVGLLRDRWTCWAMEEYEAVSDRNCDRVRPRVSR